VDGYNEELAGQSVSHLLRFNQQRELTWETTLDWGDIVLSNVLVAFNQSIYAVGTIRDAADSSHIQGLLVHYDGEGNLVWEKRFDSPYAEDSDLDQRVKGFSGIEQIKANLFVITGFVGGEKDSDGFSKAYVLQVDRDGEYLEEFTTEVITERVEAVDIIRNGDGEIVVLGNSYSSNGIAGSFLSLTQNTNSAVSVLPSNIKVYPNPAEDFLLLASADNPVEQMSIRIYNSNGHLVMQQKGSERIDISSIDGGYYIMTINNNRDTYRVQFIKN